jgi:hypothetical protein
VLPPVPGEPPLPLPADPPVLLEPPLPDPPVALPPLPPVGVLPPPEPPSSELPPVSSVPPFFGALEQPTAKSTSTAILRIKTSLSSGRLESVCEAAS